MLDPERFDLTANLILVHFEGCLSRRERQFLEGLSVLRGPLSSEQRAAFDDIWKRLQGPYWRRHGGFHG